MTENKIYTNKTNPVEDKDIFHDVFVSNNKYKICQIRYAFDRLKQYFSYQKFHLEEIKKFNKNRKNGEFRLNRTQGRESMYQVAKVLFSNLELSTMEIKKSHNSSRGCSHEELRKQCELLTKPRYKRAFLKLKKAGFIETFRKFEKSKEKYYALPAVKIITYKFFKALGIDKYYQIGKNYKLKKLEQLGLTRKVKAAINDKLTESNNIITGVKKNGFSNKPINLFSSALKTISKNIATINNNDSTHTDEELEAIRKKLLNHKLQQSINFSGNSNIDLYSTFKKIIYGYNEDMLLKTANQLSIT